MHGYTLVFNTLQIQSISKCLGTCYLENCFLGIKFDINFVRKIILKQCCLLVF